MAQDFSLCLFSKWPDIFGILPLCPFPGLDKLWNMLQNMEGRRRQVRHFVFPLWSIPPKPFQNLMSFCASFQITVSQLQVHLEGALLLLSGSCPTSKQGGLILSMTESSQNSRMYGSTWQPRRPDPGWWSPSFDPTQLLRLQVPWQPWDVHSLCMSAHSSSHQLQLLWTSEGGFLLAWWLKTNVVLQKQVNFSAMQWAISTASTGTEPKSENLSSKSVLP